MTAEPIRIIALNEELQTSHKLIAAGFGALQEVDMGNTFYHLPHQLIASGIERLLKCYISLVIQGTTGSFPDRSAMKDLGHDLTGLLTKVADHHYGGLERPLLKAELEFLRTDPTLQRCVAILSNFGKQGRYYNLDVVAGAQTELIDPTEEWKNLEQSIEDATPYLEDTEKLYRDYYPRVNSKLIAIMERLVRAIALQFTLGGHPDPEGNLSCLSVAFSDFRNLRDAQLGTRDYRRSVHILKQEKLNWVRRTDQEILGGLHPVKLVHQADFEGEWPFRAEAVIVECRGKLCAIVNVEGYAFALNGLAAGHFNLPGPHPAGVAILGRSIGPFIDMALSLGKTSEGGQSGPANVLDILLPKSRDLLDRLVRRSRKATKGRS
jgi:hypothetical protein